MDIIQLFLSFKGRVNRKTYWLALLPLTVGYIIADLMTESAGGSFTGPGYVIMIALVWPSLAVQTKRWHDRNKSGWWNLIGFVPIAGPIWAFIELGFLQGTPGENSYGPPPAARTTHDYGVRPSDARRAYVGEPLEESKAVASGSSISNSWRTS